MFYILWYENDVKRWDLIDGEDSMQVFVDDIVNRFGLNPDEDVIVFPADAKIE